jgi:hypothetical protein
MCFLDGMDVENISHHCLFNAQLRSAFGEDILVEGKSTNL